MNTTLPTCQACGYRRLDSDAGPLGVCPKCGMPYAWGRDARPAPAPAPKQAIPQERAPAPTGNKVPASAVPGGHIEACVASGLLALGCFAPIISVPIVGTLNYVGNGSRDGMFVVALAFIGLALALAGRMRALVVTGGLAALLIVFDLVQMASKLGEAKADKCKQPDGTTVFADAPCAAGAKPIDVSPASGHARGDATRQEDMRQGESAPGVARAPTRNEQADIAVRRRLLQNDIDLQERRIAATLDEMNAKLAELRNRKRYANNNLAGATWEQSISEEMSATSASYETELKGMRDELARLRQTRDRVGQ